MIKKVTFSFFCIALLGTLGLRAEDTLDKIARITANGLPVKVDPVTLTHNLTVPQQLPNLQHAVTVTLPPEPLKHDHIFSVAINPRNAVITGLSAITACIGLKLLYAGWKNFIAYKRATQLEDHNAQQAEKTCAQWNFGGGLIALAAGLGGLLALK